MRTAKSSYTIQPYDISIRIYFSYNPLRLVKRLIKDNPDPEFRFKEDWLEGDGAVASTNAGFAGKDKSEYVIFCVFDANEKGVPQIIVHESVHVLSFLLLHTGGKYDPLNDESMAYTVDYVFGLMMKTFNKLKK